MNVSVNFGAHQVPQNPSSVPAHCLYTELATRITTQRLHYRSGDEETAAKSIYSLFQSTRELMAKHPDATDFHAVALILLNDILRPYTARWHGWMTQDGDKLDKEGKARLKFRDEWVRRKFREELLELQAPLRRIRSILFSIRKGKKRTYHRILGRFRKGSSGADLGNPLALKIRSQIPLHGAGEQGRREDRLCSCRLLAKETRAVRKRREAMSGAPAAKKEITDTCGLALSGGGIRSATFCLGIVQTLQRRGIFNQIDYLSTVSGGGYLGAFLSSYLGTQDKAGAKLPQQPSPPQNPAQRVEDAFTARDGGAESIAVRHLRNNSKYLLNGGNWGLLRIAGVMVSGFFTSLLMLLTVPLLMAWITLGMKKLADQPCLEWTQAAVFMPAPFHLPYGGLLFWLLGILLVLWLFLPWFQRLAHGSDWNSPEAKTRGAMESTTLLAAILTVLVAGLCLSFPLVAGFENLGVLLRSGFGLFSIVTPPDWLVGLVSGLFPAIFGALTKRKDGTVRKWAQWLFYITGPLFFLFAFLIFASHLGVGSQGDAGTLWPCVTLVLVAWAFLFLNINTFAPHRYYRNRLCECYLAVPGKAQRTWVQRGVDSLLHGVPAGVESTDDQIEGQGQGKDKTEDPDRQPVIGTVKSLPLTALGASPAAPYHLINATLNAAASKNPELRGRNGDFFLFSRHYCGSPLTGYIKTEDLEKVEPAVDLGTAMAISGAAASTNMGWKTLRSFRFLMTLFNVRLGYWMRRPGSPKWPWPCEGPGPIYFIREMLGAVHERTRYVNLSDGGHIENLAAYELLRRQCKFIVCVDAGMEPGMECADLMRLQRYAAIDFGIQMHFDPADLTLLPTSYSRAYAILIKIDYAPGQAKPGRETSDQLGWMLYLKLAVTGTEPRHILDYRRQNPDFPHQTTGDQLYDEAQFESYRALGECAVESLFRDEIIGSGSFQSLKVHDWFQHLANSLLADNDEVFGKS